MMIVKRILAIALAAAGPYGHCAPSTQIDVKQVCAGSAKCIGSTWALSAVKADYRLHVKPESTEEGIVGYCLEQDGIFMRVQYDLRSKNGTLRPAALDIASDGPPEHCQQVVVSGPLFHAKPVELGKSEEYVRQKLGPPSEVWQPATSDHGLLDGEVGYVYSGAENDFLLIVLREGKVVRVAGSSLP